MADQEPIGPELERRGWAAGCVISAKDLECLQEYLERPTGERIEVGPDDWLVVVSQTCDVVARKLTAEPWVELLRCRAIPKPRSQCKELRSTRYLDFRPNHSTHPDLAVSAHATNDRLLVPRDKFLGMDPDPTRSLSENSVLRVQGWFALRYSRPAWPSAFVDRMNSVRDRLLEILDPLRDDIAEVRVAIEPKYEELGSDQPYKVAIYFVVDGKVWGDEPEARQQVQQAFMDFVAALESCDGIEVNRDVSDALSGDEFTWQETRTTDEWNFANLSNPDPT